MILEVFWKIIVEISAKQKMGGIFLQVAVDGWAGDR